MEAVIAPATITEMKLGERNFVNVALAEVGKYTIPANVLQGQVRQRALEVARISVYDSDHLLIEPQKGVVTTEWLADDVRLEVFPKMPAAGLHLLLQLSTHETQIIPGQLLPLSFESGLGVYDLFAHRLLLSLEEILRNGWMPLIDARTVFDPAIVGDVDALRSLEHLLTRLEVGFYQVINAVSYQAPLNRVLRTALVYLVRAKGLISTDLLRKAQDILWGMPLVTSYGTAAEALSVCERLLHLQRIEPTRAYYYPALWCALPILQAASPKPGGQQLAEDAPLRIPMPGTFESAIRNVTSLYLAPGIVVQKGGDESLYRAASDEHFNPDLEPDLVLRPLGRLDKCLGVFDVKYKERPSPSDHYQLQAYLAGHDAAVGGFVCLADNKHPAGVRSWAEGSDGRRVFEYTIQGEDLAGSLQQYSAWMQGQFRQGAKK